MGLADRVVRTSDTSIRGVVAATGNGDYRWMVKQWHPVDPPRIIVYGKAKTTGDAFRGLYRELQSMGLEVVN